MVMCSAAENILDTLSESILAKHIDVEELENIAESIAKNLCIEYQKFPKWNDDNEQ